MAKDKTLDGNPKSPTKRNPLVQAYLDDLLLRSDTSEETMEDIVSEARPPGPPKPTRRARPSSETAADSDTQISSPVERVSAVADWDSATVTQTETQTDVAADTKTAVSRAVALAAQPETPRYPDWASYDFDCLIFEVAGIRLSAPMECLGGIHSLADYERAPLFGQPDWYLGVVSIHGQQMKLLDTSLLLMPEQNKRMTLEQAKYAVQLNKSDWCLACHSLSDSVMIDNQSVRWRGKRQQRPWFIGTLIDHMCSVIDADRLEQHLNEITKKSQ